MHDIFLGLVHKDDHSVPACVILHLAGWYEDDHGDLGSHVLKMAEPLSA